MAQLAIKGNEKRSKDIFTLFEMLGGKNNCGLKETYNCFYYYMISDNSVVLNTPDSNEVQNSARMTIEEFEKKYPYKVGDEVMTTYNKLPYTAVIKGMRWSSIDECVLYQVGMIDNVRVEHILPVECIDFVNHPPITNGIEVILGDYEFVLKDGKTYFVKKKPQYPKTYEECCEVLDYEPDRQTVTGYDAELIENLQTLKMCRDAYWKIAGEEMGLGKSWEPDFTNFEEDRYGLYTCANKIVLDSYGGGDVNVILTFPTEEMRDAFYENFKVLIERCKELL